MSSNKALELATMVLLSKFAMGIPNEKVLAVELEKMAGFKDLSPIRWITSKMGKGFAEAGTAMKAPAKAHSAKLAREARAVEALKTKKSLEHLDMDPRVYELQRSAKQTKELAAKLKAGGGQLPPGMSDLDPEKVKKLQEAGKDKWKLIAGGLAGGLVGGKALGGGEGTKVIKY